MDDFAPAVEAALHELWNFISSNELRNLLASGRGLAELARTVYEHLVTTAVVLSGEAHTSQDVTTHTSATLYPASKPPLARA